MLFIAKILLRFSKNEMANSPKSLILAGDYITGKWGIVKISGFVIFGISFEN